MTEPTSSSESSEPAARISAHRRHLLLLGCIAVLSLSTCTSFPADMAGETSPTAYRANQDAPPLPSLPEAEPVDGSGAPLQQDSQRRSVDGDVAEDFGPVETQQPVLRLTEGEATTNDSVGAALEVDGVRFATAIRVGELPMATADGPTTIKAAVVEPRGFRVFTPQATADATDVWARIVDGDIAMTHDTGRQLEVDLGERLPAGGDRSTVRVGAFASNGIPPVADAIIASDAADEVSFDGALQLLVSLEDDADPNAVAARLTEATGLESEIIEQPETQQADDQAAGQSQSRMPAASHHIEPFSYQSIGDGMIQIDPAWVRRNIVSASVPVFRGNVTCHRAMVPQLRAALTEIVERDLAHLINASQYGGCWVPRHIMFDPRRNLSMHAWGLAVDFNVSSNQYGAQPQMDPRIVEVFQKWGFSWGGHWSTPDGMHFELRTLMDVPG